MKNGIAGRVIFLYGRIFLFSTFICLTSIATSHARTDLSGTISAMTVSAEGNPIIVKDNIIIPKNGHMTIAKGCQLFFKPYTGIIVEGSLSIDGTPDERVLFTSINDSLSEEKTPQPANPFDWNGILVTKQAQNISLRNFVIKYSVYGIKSQNANMTIDNGIFNGNGQFNCTVNDKIMPVVDNLAFNYESGKKDNPSPKPEQARKKSLVLPIAIGATTVFGAASLGFMGYYLHQRGDYIPLYNKASTQNARLDYLDKINLNSRNSAISGVAGGVLLATAGVLTVVYLSEKKEDKVTVLPIIGTETGMMVSFEF
jgi:hypothetical protein